MSKKQSSKKKQAVNTAASAKKSASVGAKKGFFAKMNRTEKISVIVISALLATAIIFGAVLGIVIGARNSRYVMFYEGIGVSEGVVTYLSSYYKNLYMQQLSSAGVAGVVDNPNFWGTVRYGQNTYGSDLKFATESFIQQLIAANVIFDQYTTLDALDKLNIKQSIDEILTYRTSGLKSEFNKITKDEFGFDFNDFEDATVLLYKAWAAKSKIFGANGENMQSFTDLSNNYYTSYKRVKFIFIRTEDTFATDAEGNRLKDDNGNDLIVDLTDDEKDEREADIIRIDNYFENLAVGDADVEYFDQIASEILNKYGNEFDPYMAKGVYLNSESAYTKELNAVIPTVIEKAIGLDEDIPASVDVKFDDSANADGDIGGRGSFVGKCYMIGMEREAGAYSKTDAYGFFSDFYSLAARREYQNMINAYADKVEVRDVWADFEPALIPYNYDYVARFV
jgi:hypothetical protein